jgi:hypothetical protein
MATAVEESEVEPPVPGFLEERLGELDHHGIVVDHHDEGVAQPAERDVPVFVAHLVHFHRFIHTMEHAEPFFFDNPATWIGPFLGFGNPNLAGP